MQHRVAASATLLLTIVSVAAAGCASGSPAGVDAGGFVMDTGVPTDAADSPTDGGSTDLCAAVDCSPMADECNDASCDPATGECQTRLRPDGLACGEAGSCVSGGVCRAGVCEGAPRPNGTACDDRDACTMGEVCTGGECGGGTSPDCSSLDAACATGMCNAATGSCEAVPVVDSTLCDDGDPCTTLDACTAGACAGAATDCSGMDDQCNTGVCDPTLGCVRAPRTDGTTCDDGARCTTPDVCTAGTCGGATVDCSGVGDACNVGSCDPLTGMCRTTPLAEGASCDDSDACTSSDICTSGTCSGTAPDCSSFADACNAGMCDPSTGACRAMPLSDGTTCDDGSLCTTTDRCTAGSCAGSAVDCSGSSTACGAASCDLGTGMCVVGSPSPVCTACTGGYCATDGSCQTSIGSLTFDFEAGLPPGWTTSGSANWTTTTTMPHGGARAAESGNISDSQQTRLIAPFNFPGATDVSFWLRTSTESSYDYLRLFLDGSEIQTWSGTTAWTLYSFAMPAGPHTVEWRYTKDGSVSSGSDTVWIDDVVITPSSTGYAPVASFDFEGSTSLPAALRTSGSALWVVTTATAHAGSNSAANGNIGDSQTSSLFYDLTLTRPGRVSFWYSVSSESSYDYLQFHLDGALVAEWSGTVGWTQRTQALTAGAHTIEWRYRKDSSVSSGSDTGWVDDILLEETAPPSTNLCAP